MTFKTTLALATALTCSATAHAAPVDLTGWIANGFQGDNSAGTWVVQPGNDAVRQTINGDPTVFFAPGSNSQGTSLSGTITPESSGDDDYIGFVLGYQNGELNSTSADFWLIDWKQGTQTFAGQTALLGLSLSHVSGDIANGPNANNSFWNHTSTVAEKVRGSTLGSTGWVDPVAYTFDLIFTADLIQVKVGGVTELSWTSAQNGGQFTDGAFGFYNYSQNPVLYAGITADVLPPAPNGVPLPATLPLVVLGLGLIGISRRRKA